MSRILATIALIVTLAVSMPGLAHAQTSGHGDFGLRRVAGEAGLKTDVPITAIVGNVIGSALAMIGVLFFILMVYGGFLWMTARGATDQVKKGQDTITMAIIGLVIILGSYAITNLVFQSVQGTPPPRNDGAINFTVEEVNQALLEGEACIQQRTECTNGCDETWQANSPEQLQCITDCFQQFKCQ